MKNGFLAVWVLIMTSSLFPAENTETQAWFVENISGRLTSNLSIWGQVHYRYSYDISDLAVHHSLLGVSYKMKPWLTLTPFMRIVHSSQGDPVLNRWSVEYRPSLDVKALGAVLPGMHNSYRCRLEYRDYPDKEEAWCIRQQIELATRNKWTRLELQPVLSDEIFYQRNKDGFYRNWLCLGMSIKVSKTLKCVPFIMLESGLGDYAGCRKFIAGSRLKFAF